MVLFPNCKINIGLNVTGKRADGYHHLQTVFYPVAVKDALEAIRADEFSFQVTGLSVEGSTNDNLCVKAYSILKKDFRDLPAVSMHLHKAIPLGAGLGGGSADGAFTLKLLNKKFNLNLSNEKLIEYALQLGSDCPFFIINKPCFATGRGENLTPVDLDLSAYKIVLVNPGIHISTREAFAKLTPTLPQTRVDKLILNPVETWKDAIVNDFETTIFQLYPATGEIKNNLYKAGAVYASMTGSGSTVFGIFRKEVNLQLPFPEHFTCLITG